MRKRIVSMLLTLSICLGMYPTGVLASAGDQLRADTIASVEIGGVTTYYYSDDTTPQLAMQLAWASAARNTAHITLYQTVNMGSTALTINNAATNITLDMVGGAELSGSVSGGQITVSAGSLTFKSGRIAVTGRGITVSGGQLTIEGGTVNSSSNMGVYVNGGDVVVTDGVVVGSSYGLRVNRGTARLSGGTYVGSAGAVAVQSGSVTDLLMDGYVYYQNNLAVDTTARTIAGNVNIKPIPVTATDPASVAVIYGMSATLSVTATPMEEGSEITYQWYRVENGTETAVGGATGASYTAALPSGDHTFYCAVTCAGYTVKTNTAVISVGEQGKTYEASVTIDGKTEYYETLLGTEGAWAKADGQTAHVTLLSDINLGSSNLTLSGGEVTLDCGDFQITGNNTYTIRVGAGILHLSGGQLHNNRYMGYGIYVYQSGRVYVDGSSIESAGEQSYGVYVASGKAVITDGEISGSGWGIYVRDRAELSGGTFHGGTASVMVSSGAAASLLGADCAYYGRESGWIYDDDERSFTETVTVRKVPVKLVRQTEGPFRMEYAAYVPPRMEVEVTAAEGTAVSYQWYRGKTPIEGATEAVYEPSRLNAGNHQFYCVISADGYEVSSQPVTVEIAWSNVVCVPPAVTAVFGQTLRELELENPAGNTPGTWTWTDPTESVGGVGAQTHMATFTPDDLSGYEIVENVAVTVTVQKAKPEISFVEEYIPDKIYDGMPIANPTADCVQLRGTDGQVELKWYYQDGTAVGRAPTNAGTYILTATVAETANAGAASVSMPVVISPKLLTGAVVECDAADCVYTGAAIMPPVQVFDGSRVIPAGEYTVEYSNNIGVGDQALVTVSDCPGGNYTVNGTATFTILPKAVEAVSARAEGKVYDGTADVAVAGVSVDGALPGEDVYVAVDGGVRGQVVCEQYPDVGSYSYVDLSGLRLSGADAGNYILADTAENVALDAPVEIVKATLAPTEMVREISTKYPYDYRWSLAELRPNVEAPMRIADPTYQIKAVDLKTEYYDPAEAEKTVRLDEDDAGTIRLPTTVHVESESTPAVPAGEAGTITLTLSFRNYEDVDCTIRVEAVNKITVDILGVEAQNSAYTGLPAAGYVGTPRVEIPYEGIPTILPVDFNYYYFGTGSTVYADYYHAPVEVGTYQTAITVAETNENYIGIIWLNFEITKAEAVCVPPQEKQSLSYCGEAQALVTAGSTGDGTMVYALREEGPYTGEIPMGTDAGTYTVWYKVLGDRNHYDSAPRSLSVTVEKAAAAVLQAPEAVSGITYDGAEHTLVMAGAADGGELYYSLDGREYSRVLPNAVNAGEHQVYYMVAGDQNHHDTAPGTVTTVIAPKTLTLGRVTAADKSYDGTAAVAFTQIELDGVAGRDAVRVDLPDVRGELALAAGAYPNAGSYSSVRFLEEIILTGSAAGNYVLTQPEGPVVLNTPVQIAKATLTPVTMTRQVVSGNAQTYRWSLTNLRPVLPEPMEYVEAPTYRLTAVELNGSYCDISGVKIVGGNEIEVPVRRLGPEVSGSLGSIRVTISTRNFTDTVCTIRVAAAGKKQLDLSGIVSMGSVPYTGQLVPGYTGTTGYGGQCEYIYTGTGSTVHRDRTAPPVEIGTYRVTVRIPEGDPNYVGVRYVDFEIVKAEPLKTAPQAKPGLIFNGEPQALVTPGTVLGGRLLYALGEGGPYTEQVPTAVAAGSYTVWYKVEGDAHYRDVAPAKVTAVIRENGEAVRVKQTEGGTVTASPQSAMPGSTVLLTAVPELGYRLEEITVLGSDGAPIAVTGLEDGGYSFVMPEGTVAVTAKFACDKSDYCPTRAYGDLSPDTWYHEAVDYVVRNGLMQGYSAVQFAPEDTLSRAMLVQILYNLAGRPSVEGIRVTTEKDGMTLEADQKQGTDNVLLFGDVPREAWYFNAMIWAADNDITLGYGDGIYAPEEPITREQFATMLWRWDGCLEPLEVAEEFPDAGEIDEYAEKALNWAHENSIVRGYPDGTVRPRGQATRTVAAQMLANYRRMAEASKEAG